MPFGLHTEPGISMWNFECAQKSELKGDLWFAPSLVASRLRPVTRGVATEPESEEGARTNGGPHERIPGRIKGRIKSCSRPAQKWCEGSGAIGSVYEYSLRWRLNLICEVLYTFFQGNTVSHLD